MTVVVQHFNGCPHWLTALDRVEQAIEAIRSPRPQVEVQLIASDEEAAAAGFRGSPTILIDGVDPFADDAAPVGLSCRVYRTLDGLAGSPTVEQLVDMLMRAGAEA